MPRPKATLPIYRLHESSGQAIVTVRLTNGKRKDVYLGVHDSPESRAEYARVLSVLAAHGGVYVSEEMDLTVNEALVRFTKHVDSYYVDEDGQPSRSADNIKFVLSYLKTYNGSTILADFGPPELKAIRKVMIDEQRARKSINKYMVVIRQFFRWCVEEQLVSPSVWEALRAVKALDIGRGGVVESKPRQPADPADFEQTVPFLPPMVQVIVRLLRLTGARPSEMLALRPCDLDRSGSPWLFTLPKHKTAYKGKSRIIRFGPNAQEILLPLLEGLEPETFVFDPSRQEAERNEARSANRQTPQWASHLARNIAKRSKVRRRGPTDRYTPNTLARAVLRGCTKAGVKPWTPYMLRHLVAVELREKYGLEHVRAVLGQSFMSMSDHYSKAADATLAARVASEIG